MQNKAARSRIQFVHDIVWKDEPYQSYSLRKNTVWDC